MLLLLVGKVGSCVAQNDSAQFTFSAYADIYTSVLPRAKGSHQALPYMFSYNRVNELAVNMVLLQGEWQADSRTALHIGLMSGTYATANLANEPALFRMLYEANLTYLVSVPKQLSLQVGVFPSHIGMESAVGIQNHCMTRSLQADNSPYYESGLKLSRSLKNNRGSVSVLVLNGWQQMWRPDGQTQPAIGHQFLYTPNARWTINSSSFLGRMDKDTMRRARYFHDAWVQYRANTHWQFSGGFDIGNQRRGAPQYGGRWWSTWQCIARYSTNERLAFCARLERANDVHHTIFSFANPSARRVHGYSVNVDYSLRNYLTWRSEVRCLKEEQAQPAWFASTSLLCYLKKSVP